MTALRPEFPAGLTFIGKYLKRTHINATDDPPFPVRSGIANSDILKSCLPCYARARMTLRH